MAKAQRSPAPSTSEPTGPVSVDNRAAHIKVFWTRDAADGAVVIPNTRQQGHNRAFRVLPGFNDRIPRRIWDLMMTQPGWKAWLDSSAVRVMTEPPTSLPPGDAIDLINRSACVKAMQRWHKHETRAPVKEALASKIVDMNQMATGKKTTIADDGTLEMGM